MLLSKIIEITKGKLLSGNDEADIDVASISTDSRTIKAGEFFLPLKGGNFDGEDFIGNAFQKGAVGTLTTKDEGKRTKGECIIIQVNDTTTALQRIAHHHRMKFDIPVIGVTGSNGKTTVKDMISKVLSSKFNVLKNEGTKNNHIGVPQTLLKLDELHDLCVLEMGTNHRGEIHLLADIARPDVAVITNIGPSHLEFLKDLEGVFESKKEIFDFLNKGSIAILNGDDEYLAKVKSGTFRILRFGLKRSNHFRASNISSKGDGVRFTLNERREFKLNILGSHNVYNALAAIAAGYIFDLSCSAIKKEFSEFTPADMRLNAKSINGFVIIDDAYNSNPLSMKCAIEAVKSYPAKAKWIVSADMLELGEREKDLHAIAGELIAKSGFDGLLTFGRLSQYTSMRAVECGMGREKVWHVLTHDEAANILRKIAKAGDLILIKGSRAMKMEQLIEKLKGPEVIG